MDLIEFKCITWDLLRDISENTNQLLAPLYETYGLTGLQLQLLLAIDENREETIGNLSRGITTFHIHYSA